MAGWISNHVCSVNVPQGTDGSSNTISLPIFASFLLFSAETSDKASIKNKQQVYKSE